MNSRIAVGVDPGASGAIAIFDGFTHSLKVHDMPVVEIKRGKRNVRHTDAAMLANLFSGIPANITHAVIERVGARPRQGVSSMFAFGRALGVIEGVLAGKGISVTMVSPQTWQKAMGVNSGKDGARARASQLYPAQASLFARKKDHGRADATLIATFAYDTLKERP